MAKSDLMKLVMAQAIASAFAVVISVAGSMFALKEDRGAFLTKLAEHDRRIGKNENDIQGLASDVHYMKGRMGVGTKEQ